MNNFSNTHTWHLFGIPDRFKRLVQDPSVLLDVPYSPILSNQTLRPLASGDSWMRMFEDTGLLKITQEEKERRHAEKRKIDQSQRRMPGTSAKDIARYSAYEDQRKQEAKEEELDQLSDNEIIQFIFLPHFSTREKATETSGRGIGMDEVKNQVKNLKGTVHVESKVGNGTHITVLIPMQESR